MYTNSSLMLPYFFIADGAYQLTNNFLKPFSKKNLNKEKKIFNRKLSHARMGLITISKCFVFMIRRLANHISVVDLIVKTSCVLRNMPIDKGQKNVCKDNDLLMLLMMFWFH